MFGTSIKKSISGLARRRRMSRLLPRTGEKLSVPGTVGYIGRKREQPVVMHVIDYDKDGVRERDIKDIADCAPMQKTDTITWLNISGVHDTDLIEQIGEFFDIHPLVLADISNTTQRPKTEEYDDYLYVVLKMPFFNGDEEDVAIEQISLVIRKDFVISFQEREGDVLDPLRERIRSDKGRIRKMGGDYLMYAIIDGVVDHYYELLERVGERIEDLEDELIEEPDQETLNKIYTLKQELVYLRKSIWPMREVVNALLRVGHKLIGQSVSVYLRDVYDHTVQVVDAVETFRDVMTSMLDLYLSTVSNKMNEVMKVLTIFATIFIPLTFIAGVYGMNFRYMPELTWHFGYFAVLGLMFAVAISMLTFFKRKDWF